MRTKNNLFSKISMSSGLALALAFAAWLPNAARSAEHEGDMGGMNMNHIKTQASASPELMLILLRRLLFVFITVSFIFVLHSLLFR